MLGQLVDPHALLWCGDRRLSLKTRRAIARDSNSILVSAASAWGITTKARLGKLPSETEAGSLSGAHRDPFDRMLIAQSQIEDIGVVTDDEAFDSFDVLRFW